MNHNNSLRLLFSRTATTPIVRRQMVTMTKVGPATASSSSTAAAATWSQSLSFASPESDFYKSDYRPITTKTTVQQPRSSWSETLSFAGPESDFTNSQSDRSLMTRNNHINNHNIWSENISFASPESDFTASGSLRSLTTMATAALRQPVSEWSQTLSFASPESDFVAAAEHVPTPVADPTPLPTRYGDALCHFDDDAAVVITTAASPHRVVHVNAAWERLCGYSRNEALHRPIGPLLQKPESSSSNNHSQIHHTHEIARHLIDQLRADHYRNPQDAYLENFTKDGRPFLNHLRVGPLWLEGEHIEGLDPNNQEPTFLIGVLEEVVAIAVTTSRRMSA